MDLVCFKHCTTHCSCGRTAPTRNQLCRQGKDVQGQVVTLGCHARNRTIDLQRQAILCSTESHMKVTSLNRRGWILIYSTQQPTVHEHVASHCPPYLYRLQSPRPKLLEVEKSLTIFRILLHRSPDDYVSLTVVRRRNGLLCSNSLWFSSRQGVVLMRPNPTPVAGCRW